MVLVHILSALDRQGLHVLRVETAYGHRGLGPCRPMSSLAQPDAIESERLCLKEGVPSEEGCEYMEVEGDLDMVSSG